MSAMGRPKSQNPKGYQTGVRFDEKERIALETYAAENHITIAETIRRAVRKFLKVK